MVKNALIVANLAGFASFLIHDIEILIGKGYTVTFAANAYKLEWADTKKNLISWVSNLFNWILIVLIRWQKQILRLIKS